MANKLIDLYQHIFKYNEKMVYIAFDDKTMNPYFHGKQMCDMLGYVNSRDTIKIHVAKKDIVYLENIVKKYKILV